MTNNRCGGAVGFGRRLAVILVALISAGGAFAVDAAPDNLVVATETGPLRGTTTASMRQFLGIPYAAPPVGERRWQPPQAPARWQGVRDATQFGNHCPQPATPFGAPSTTEDCLYLNVYTPKDLNPGAAHRLPVMVWIHGGAMYLGHSNGYNPTRLVEQDVVVVTINYRLGILGFLAHPALTAESTYGGSGNYGLMDQQAALRWVQRNIARFGGDPDNVTIFGESAGGLSVHSHLASPESAGLFHRAIIQSGAYALQQAPLAVAEMSGASFATTAGCADQTAECLRGLPVAQILANQPGGSYIPNIDNRVLPVTIGTALATGQFNQVPVLQGSTHDEWRLFVALNQEFVTGPLTPAQYIGAIQSTLGVPPATAAFIGTAVYPLAAYPSPSIALGAIGTDAVFACTARTSIRLLAQHVPTFAYEFNDPNAPQQFLPPASFPYGAYHASEIQYLFDTPAGTPSPAFTADQLALSNSMVRYWTSFAKGSNPNSANDPFWAPYDPAVDNFQSLAPPTPTVTTGFAADHKCSFWAPGS